jgi:hypothetical protein
MMLNNRSTSFHSLDTNFSVNILLFFYNGCLLINDKLQRQDLGNPQIHFLVSIRLGIESDELSDYTDVVAMNMH